MGLNPGSRLGAYEIVAPLGAGGMGEVYRARDTRLDRHVALKLLADGVAGNADRLARFEREARAASALNHPSIVTIYDVGSTDEHPWISMELVEGKTLRELIEGGPVPLRRALTLAAQIADGLAKAHEAGIIHRDLKPENVMVTADGFAKILDFGLARLTGPESTGDAETRTLQAGTHPGTVMGTLAYMSPEQASGAAVDFRSDQFSFGAVVYELLTAQRAFGRASSMDTLSAILRDQPTPIGQLNATIPSPVRWIVERCVEKQAADRYASTRDLARDLATARDRLSELSAAPVALEDRVDRSDTMSRREQLAWALAVVLPLVIGAWLLWSAGSRPEAERTSVRLSLSPPENVTVSGDNMPPFDLSPDGRRLVLVGVNEKGTNSLWVRSLDSLTWQPLAGTDGAIDPFWSFDGREIGFFTAEKILRVPASGGDVQTISNTPFAMGGAWGADGVVLFTDQTGMYRVPASGGTPTQLVKRVPDFAALWPRVLPDGRRILYFVLGAEATGLYMSSVDSPEPTKLVALGPNDLTVLGFTEPDYLLYVQNRNLMAQRLDVEKRVTIGDAIRIAEGVDVNAPSSAFSASLNGTVVYWSGSRDTSELTWVDRKGQSAGGVAARGSFNDLAISPDGRRLAVGRVDTSPFSIWIVDLARGGTTTRLATDSFAASPTWSPDGGQLAFGSARNSPPNLYLATLERGGPEEQLTRSSFIEFPLHWSPDGSAIVFNRQEPQTGWDLWIAPLVADRTLRPIFNTKAYESEARISPDGRWMAYVSDESGRSEVYVTSFPNPGDRWKVSSNGGSRPIWKSDVRELYYRAQERIFAASVVTVPEFKAGSPTLLFEAAGLPREQTGKVSFDVAPDGRFLLNRIVERISPPLTVITDWRAGLNK